MPKRNVLILSISILISVIILFTLTGGDSLFNDYNHLTDDILVIPVMMQTATVSCKDTENYGEGPLRGRICAEGTTATCDWNDYRLPASDGTCTLSDLEVD